MPARTARRRAEFTRSTHQYILPWQRLHEGHSRAGTVSSALSTVDAELAVTRLIPSSQRRLCRTLTSLQYRGLQRLTCLPLPVFLDQFLVADTRLFCLF